MNNTITKLENNDFKVEQNETCIMCDVETDVLCSMHIDFRHNYIEGAGQLCSKCYSGGTNRNHLAIPEHIIYNTPNDQILGAKVRELYFESKK